MVAGGRDATEIMVDWDKRDVGGRSKHDQAIR